MFPVPQGTSIDASKLLGQKYYLTHTVSFESYLKLTPDPPTDPAPYTVSRILAAGLNDLPYSWITPQAPRDLVLPLAYCFKFDIWANCTTGNWGVFIATFWRYRDGVETKIYTCRPSSGHIAYGSLSSVTWFEWINATLHIQQGDRLILKLQIYALQAGRFYMGLDCQQFQSYIFDPYTEYLGVTGDGTDTLLEWPDGYPSTPPPHYDKVDDNPCDNDSSYIMTDEAFPGSIFPVYYNNFLYSDSALGSRSIVSVTAYMTAKRINDWDAHPANAQVSPGLFNATSGLYSWGTATTLTNTYANYSRTWTTNPFTTRAWTVADINALELSNRGQTARIRYSGTYYRSYARDTRTFIIVEYTGAVTTVTLNQAVEITQTLAYTRRLTRIFEHIVTITQTLDYARRLTRIFEQGAVVWQFIEAFKITGGPLIVIVTINQLVEIVQTVMTAKPGFQLFWIVPGLFVLCVVGCLFVVGLRRRKTNQ